MDWEYMQRVGMVMREDFGALRSALIEIFLTIVPWAIDSTWCLPQLRSF